MIRGFKSVGWVAAVGGAALGCYMLSLQVATERADLARVERQIIAAKQQIRSLQTELGTRGRLSQLEQWNREVLALAAPASGQYLQDEFTLARLERHDLTIEERAEVRMASLDVTASPAAPAPARDSRPVPAVEAPAAPVPRLQTAIVHRASFTPPEPGSGKPAKAAEPQRPRRLGTQLAADLGAAARTEKVRGARAELARSDTGREGGRAAARPSKEARADTGRDEDARPIARNERRRSDSETPSAARTDVRPAAGSAGGAGTR